MHMEKLRKKYAGQRQANMGEEILTTGVDESSIAAHQYKEDQERLEQMRAKEAEGVTFTQSSFDIKLCLLCMGEGKVKEHYGYREMQVAHCPSPQLILQYAHMFWCQTVYETHNVFVSLGFAQISKTNQMGMTRCVLLGSCDKFVELIHEF